MKLDESLPAHRKLSMMYPVSAGVAGVVPAFRIPNAIFGHIVWMVVLTLEVCGRVSGNRSRDAPYGRERHPDRADAEDPGTTRTEPA